MGRVLLVRHAESTWNRERRVQGWAPSELTAAGRSKAALLGAELAGSYDVDRIVASDLRRVVETVRQLRQSLDAPVEYDADWRERDFGVLQGLSHEALFEGYPEFSLTATGYEAVEARPERGESWLDTRQRVLASWRELRANLSDETVLVVSHGGPIRIVLADFLGLDAVAAVTGLEDDPGVAIDNLSVTEILVEGDDAELVRRTERFVE